MTHYVIFDRNAGFLQWSGEYESAEEAIKAFDAKVGIDPHGKGLDAVAEEFDIRDVTAEQRAAVEHWWENGGKGEFPL